MNFRTDTPTLDKIAVSVQQLVARLISSHSSHASHKFSQLCRPRPRPIKSPVAAWMGADNNSTS